MEDFDLITMYKEMKSIKKICEDLEIDYSNLLTGRTTKESVNIVAHVDKVHFASAKNIDPSLPHFCHPDVYLIWHQSAPTLEKVSG